MADIEPRRAAVQRGCGVGEIDRDLGGVAAAGGLVGGGRPKGLE